MAGLAARRGIGAPKWGAMIFIWQFIDYLFHMTCFSSRWGTIFLTRRARTAAKASQKEHDMNAALHKPHVQREAVLT